MLLSINWLRDFVALPEDLDVATLQHDLTLRTVEVEGAHDVGARLDGTVLGLVVDSGPGTVSVDVGGDTLEAAISSAHTLRVGGRVAVALSGSPVAPDHARVCTPADLGLDFMFPPVAAGLPLDTSEINGQPGDPIAPLVGWDDVVLDIDNKSLTNRPDLWSHAGIARELAAILGVGLLAPPSASLPDALATDALIGSVDSAACNRFTLVSIERSGPMPATPLWMRSRLARVGQRAVNLYADITNYVMFAVGQPSHVYDRTALALPLNVRFGTDNAKPMPFLNGQEVEVDASMAVIADGTGTVAIAGVVGNSATQVTSATTSVLLEAGNFDRNVVRTAVLRKGCRTDAAARFEKGMDTQGIDRGRAMLVELIRRLDPTATFTGTQEVTRATTTPSTVETTCTFLNDRLGTNLDVSDVAAKITPLGFKVTGNGDSVTVVVPTWRSTGDVSIPNDVLEEVARMIGYDQLPPSAPSIELRFPGQPGPRLLERRLREYLAHQVHAQEVMTYPWASHRQLQSTGWAEASLVEIEAPPSPDRRFLRPALLPNLLEAVRLNLGHSSSFRLFELGTVFLAEPRPPHTEAGEPLPKLSHHLAATFVGSDLEAEFRAASGAVEGLVRAGWLKDIAVVASDRGSRTNEPLLEILSDGVAIGRVALAWPHAAGMSTGRDVAISYFELELDGLATEPSRTNTFRPIRTHPATTVDLSIVVPVAITWAELSRLARGANELIRSVAYVEEYQGPSIPRNHRSITLRLTIAADDRTLQIEEAMEARDALLDLLVRRTGAVVRA